MRESVTGKEAGKISVGGDHAASDFPRARPNLLEGMFVAGLEKLHVGTPGAEGYDMVVLLDRLAPRWASRLVLHGSAELAERYGIPQIHGAVELRGGKGRSGGGPVVGASHGGGLVAAAGGGSELGATGDGSVTGRPGPAISTSVHSWEEFEALPVGLTYAFISPLFDSISKPGYSANMALLSQPEWIASMYARWAGRDRRGYHPGND